MKVAKTISLILVGTAILYVLARIGFIAKTKVKKDPFKE